MTIKNYSMQESFPAFGFLRPAVIDDIPQLVAMINAAYAVETFLEGTRTSEESLLEVLKTGRILLIEADDKIVASLYMERRENSGYLGMLAVSPTHQRMGLATQLLEAAEDDFRVQGLKTVEIHVLNLRPELLPLYRRYGFVESGTEEFTYPRAVKGGASCHCIVMTKQL